MRETGTQNPDLPHEYESASVVRLCEVCGKKKDDEIHRVDAERASSTPSTPRERGS